MAKPLLLSAGNGKVSEFVGNATGQTVVWSEGADEWVLGTPSSSGGGGVTFYLNRNTTAESPTTNLPTGASGAVVKELGAAADAIATQVVSTVSLPVLPANPEIIAGFVTDVAVPGLTGIPAGLWDFNIWAKVNGNTTNQSYIQFKVYKYNGSTAPTFIASSVSVYLYDPADVTQYTASVLIPAGTSLLTTDRIYVEVVGGSTTSNRQITLHFGNGEPSHVHTTVQVPVNLATGVSGILPVANGGTGLTLAGTSGNLLVSDGSALASVAVSSDATLASTGALTLKNTGTAGTFGSASTIPVFTTDGKGRVTGVTATNIAINASAITSGVLGAANGGTGQSSYAIGDLLYATGTTTLSRLADVVTGRALLSGGVGAAPSWGQIGLTTHVTGTLSVANGGTGVSSLTSNALLVGGATVGALSGTASGQVATWNGTQWTAAAPAASGTVTSVSSSTTLSGLMLSTTTGTTTPAISLTGTLEVSAGGTGATTLTGYVKGAGTASMTASATIPVADVTGAAPLASPAFSGTPSLPTGTTGFTQTAGNNTTALATTAFVTTAVAAAAAAPYDLPFEISGTPATSTKVVNFKAVRAFTLAATGHQGGQITPPSGNFVCTVMKNVASIGTITFGTSSFSSSVTATSFAIGDVLSVTTPAAALGIDTPFATFFMTLA